jgi:hypothetical protein
VSDRAKDAERFQQVAARFCALVESEPAEPVAEMRVLARLLAELYLCASDLPEVDLDDASAPLPRSSASSGAYSKARDRFAHLPLESYWDVFDPLVQEPEAPVYNSLGDDLGDVYADLVRGFELLAHRGIDPAVFEWRLSFFSHWGNHLVGAQRAIFLWLAGHQS